MRRLLLSLLLVASTAHGQATAAKMLLPGVVSMLSLGGYRAPTVTNTLYCWTVPAPFTLPLLTKLSVTITDNPATTVSFAIYPDSDAGVKLAGMTQLADPPTGTRGPITVTGLDGFNLIAGTMYRLCHCAGTGDIVTYGQVQQATTCCENVNLTQLTQTFTPNLHGTAANACTGTAVLPATTGAITAESISPGRNAKRIPIFLVE